jgi:2,4-dienoyl-CoA reductase (NADPH2)
MLGEGMVGHLFSHVMTWFMKKGVPAIAGVKEMEITKQGVNIVTKDGKKSSIQADTVVPAIPLSPGLLLFNSLEGRVPEIYAVGDCKDPLLIVDAIGSGSRVAQGI